jgi:hypothetical protein
VFLRAGVRPDYPAVMLPATLLLGLAFGLGFSSLSVAATAGVPDAEQGLAASLFQTSFQVGGAVVLAIVTAVVDAGGAGRLASAPVTLAAYRPALVLITAVAAIGALVALSGLRSQPDLAVTGERASDDTVLTGTGLTDTEVTGTVPVRALATSRGAVIRAARSRSRGSRGPWGQRGPWGPGRSGSS